MQSDRVSFYCCRQIHIHVRVHLQALAESIHGHEVHGLLHHAPDIHNLLHEVKLSRLDARQVQNVIDQTQQRDRRCGHLLSEDLLLRRHSSLNQQLQIPDYNVQGRPHLVRHVRKEARLCVVGSPRLRNHDLLLHLHLHLCHVLHQQDRSDGPSVRVLSRGHVDQDFHELASLCIDPQLDLGRGLPLDRLFDDALHTLLALSG
mmetsp:Transcript_18354/g.45047  ORF Transcript_18354/g.45047 Transcript_18354/m.45047 type:complete len:203 (+) Transcript_18354:1969-2577(+)